MTRSFFEFFSDKVEKNREKASELGKKLKIKVIKQHNSLIFITKYCGSNFQNFHNCGTLVTVLEANCWLAVQYMLTLSSSSTLAIGKITVGSILYSPPMVPTLDNCISGMLQKS